MSFVSLCDVAIYDKLGEVLSRDRSVPVRGVFVPDSEAFRTYRNKYGELKLPIYSLFWSSLERSTNRYNRPTANHGFLNIRNDNLLGGKRLRMFPIDVNYDVHIWHTHEFDLINCIDEFYFYSQESGGNGVTINQPELFDEEIGVPFSMDYTLSIEKTQIEEQGRYYHAYFSVVAHTFFVKGLDVNLIRKLVLKIYTNPTEVEIGDRVNRVLVGEKEFKTEI